MTLGSHLYNYLGLNRKQETARETHVHRIRKDTALLHKLMNFIKSCRNPFTVSQQLVNLSSGKASSAATQQFLLSIREKGESMRKSFIQRCITDPAAFLQPIPRQRLMTFSCEGVKIKKKGTDNKIVQTRMERDLMGRLLAIAVDHKIDMNNVLSYPLTPIPLCFSHIDGQINTNPKASFLKCLEQHNVSSFNPCHIDVKIVDGFFLLHLLVDLPTTFGKIALHILTKLCGMNCKRVDIVFNDILTPSIKDIERDRRSGSDRDGVFTISGPNQIRPSDFLKALRSDNFKKQLVNFFASHFDNDCFSDVIGDKTVRMTVESKCFVFTATEGRVLKELDERLSSTHEEADSKMITHLASITGPANVVIRTSDTDVLVVALGNIDKIKSGVKVFS